MSTNESDIPEEDKCTQTWGKDPEEVIYGRGEVAEDDDDYRCANCNSRIDEFGYCACGGNLGIG
jgi:DNA-directed RNA polymerase subunit RPC12/RpoP